MGTNFYPGRRGALTTDWSAAYTTATPHTLTLINESGVAAEIIAISEAGDNDDIAFWLVPGTVTAVIPSVMLPSFKAKALSGTPTLQVVAEKRGPQE
jgi:hypothetical protein